MKGISPLIAAVLLIAFTVAVGGIISLWLTTFSRTTTTSVQTGTEKQIKCASTTLEINSVALSSNKIVITNLGPQEVNLTSIILSDGFTTRVNYADRKLSPGASISLETNSTNYVEIPFNLTGSGAHTNLKYVVVKGLCLEEVPVEAKCTSGETCWTA
ncbi:MAG: hypothetical protein J7L39_00050 [Candidatus Aenigmarchaeota archaeon]|nr:hypothetical protein [Candidatus Aenigmarchaeota archaeon]